MLITEYAYFLAPGGMLYTITDVKDLGTWMVSGFVPDLYGTGMYGNNVYKSSRFMILLIETSSSLQLWSSSRQYLLMPCLTVA